MQLKQVDEDVVHGYKKNHAFNYMIIYQIVLSFNSRRIELLLLNHLLINLSEKQNRIINSGPNMKWNYEY